VGLGDSYSGGLGELFSGAGKVIELFSRLGIVTCASKIIYTPYSEVILFICASKTIYIPYSKTLTRKILWSFFASGKALDTRYQIESSRVAISAEQPGYTFEQTRLI